MSSVWAGWIRGDKGRDREDYAVVQARHAGLGKQAEKTVEETLEEGKEKAGCNCPGFFRK